MAIEIREYIGDGNIRSVNEERQDKKKLTKTHKSLKKATMKGKATKK